MGEQQIRGQLNGALVAGTVKSLERSTTAFMESHLEDTDGNLRKANNLLRRLKIEKQTTSLHRVKDALKSSMKRSSVDDLEIAIASAEHVGHRELEEQITLAKEKLLKVEKKELYEAKESFLCSQLEKATEERKLQELEKAITEFQKIGVRKRGALETSKRVLYELYEEAAAAASQDDLRHLEQILGDARKSTIAKELLGSKVLKRAENFLQQQKRIRGSLSKILELNNSTLAEIQRYKDPRPIIQDVMKATIILLGETPENVETWKSLQAYLKRSGDVVKKINAVRKDSLHKHTIKWANKLLGRYTTDDIREVSAGVAALYQWCNNMIREDIVQNIEGD